MPKINKNSKYENEKFNYHSVIVQDKNKQKHKWYVHEIIAEADVKNDDPVNKTYILHKDGNIFNNDSDNLQWVTEEAYRSKMYPKIIVGNCSKHK
jgi:hypothetical protein